MAWSRNLVDVLVAIVGLLACHAVAQQWMGALNRNPPASLPRKQAGAPLQATHVDRCQVEHSEMIQCGTRDITREQCGAINCCHNGHQCYYGKAVTVQCTRDGQFVVVVARDSTSPPVDVNSISLMEMNDPTCNAVDTTATFAIFQFPMTMCGTTIKEEDNFVVYENHMSSSYEVGIGPRGSITRDSHFELLFQCRYSGTAVEALVVEVNDLPPPESVAAAGPLRVELRLANGECFTKGCVEEEAAYNSFYTAADYPVTKVLKQPVYVEVRILERSDPNIVLNLERCWATTAPNPNSVPQWDLLVDGCPYHDDRYQTIMVPVRESSTIEYPTHYKRFIFKMFTFVDPKYYSPQKDRVFIHCSTAVCNPTSANSCAQLCHHRHEPGTRISQSQDVVSSNQVILTPVRGFSSEPLKKWR
ncbi:zona pellucida sperm-binding protein 4-like [Syngnathoides biaculeatus]|uniref:zona pellucida sperm-binding protein 4-like n=1 Tax=Syngnathoides biaculeatus TaxID=300417 RepID=UPI002ADD7D94|nr:zona pellucida sperm-binding protein 4-like [Syngnathoides biaculeatus]